MNGKHTPESYENRTGFTREDTPYPRARLYIDHDPSLIFPWTPRFPYLRISDSGAAEM